MAAESDNSRSEQHSPGPCRYVVLRHTGYGTDHFDLMIESGPGSPGLLTWRAADWPLTHKTALLPLGPHRRAYLDYEGQVSAGRGQVNRIAGGRCWLTRSGGDVLARFEGEEGTWNLGSAGAPPLV